MGGDIGEIQLGSERELYKKYINHYAVVKRKYSKIILVQVYIIFALPDYSTNRYLLSTASTPAFFCSSLMKAMYCVTKPLLTGLPVLSVLFQTCVTPRSRSYTMASLGT